MVVQVELSGDSVIPPAQLCLCPGNGLGPVLCPTPLWLSPVAIGILIWAVTVWGCEGDSGLSGKSLDSQAALPSLGLVISFGGVECWTTPDYGQG